MALRLTVALALASLTNAGLNGQQMDEYLVKAAFLYNFARFVEWPQEDLRHSPEPFQVCVLGPDPFGQALDDVVEGKSIGGQPFAVRRISDAGQTGGCHILYVSSSAAKRILSTLATATLPGILTVGEADNPISRSVMINFIHENNRVRFDINVNLAVRARIHISSKLLSLAHPASR
jgi:hypothetical protein